VKVPDREGLAPHPGPESCVHLGNECDEALTGDGAGRVLRPDIRLFLGADALRTRGRLHRRRRYGEASMDPAGSETSGMHGTTRRGIREALHLAWRRIARSARGPRQGYDRGVRGQGVGAPHSIDEAPEQRLSCARAGGGRGEKGAGQGERGPASQGPEAEPGSPCPRCSTAYGRPLRVPARHDPRQEPGAVVPHAGSCAGGAG
jgi:hypothetical protein